MMNDEFLKISGEWMPFVENRSVQTLQIHHAPLQNYFFGRLEPYLERLFLRLFTPAVSSAPRTMV